MGERINKIKEEGSFGNIWQVKSKYGHNYKFLTIVALFLKLFLDV